MERIKKIHNISLSTDAEYFAGEISIRQHDYGTNTVRVQITDQPDLLGYENRVFIIFRKGSTVTEEYACETDKNTVSFEVPNAVISDAGYWCAEIRFYGEDGSAQRASSAIFSFNVMPDIEPFDGQIPAEQVQTLYERIAEYCRAKLDEIASTRFSIVDGRLTVVFSGGESYDLGLVKGRDAVTGTGSVTLYSELWDDSNNSYTFTLAGLGTDGSVFFKPATLTDKTLLEDADCFIVSSGTAVTVTAANLPEDDITLEYVLIGG